MLLYRYIKDSSIDEKKEVKNFLETSSEFKTLTQILHTLLWSYLEKLMKKLIN